MAEHHTRPGQKDRQGHTRSDTVEEGKVLRGLTVLLEWMAITALLAAIVVGLKLIA